MGIERRLESRLRFLIFNACERKYKNEAVYVLRAFHKVVYPSRVLKIYEDIRYQNIKIKYFDLLYKLKFVLILQYLRQFRRYKNGRPHFENLKTRRFRYKL